MPIEDGAAHFLKGFSDPDAVARYVDGPRRFVPGIDALHKMVGILLAERVPADGRILVLGAGGGLELRALAEFSPGWRFTGVDPAAAMLDLAEQTAAAAMDRIDLIEGYIDDAPQGPFDGAVCLLTLHFLAPQERQRTLAQIHRRLRPDAPLVVAHGSYPEAGKDMWLARYAAFAAASGVEKAQAEQARAAVAASVNMLDPAQDEAIFSAAGFRDIAMFYAAFTWRGWVGYA